MIPFFRAFLCLLILGLVIGCTTKKARETAFYVSKSGNDSWSGKLPEPNKNSTDGPFASLDKARDAIRALKKSGPLPEGGVMVNLRGGVYSISNTFKLTSEDSGTNTSPVVWRAYPDETVQIIGGTVVTGFTAVTDPAVLKRIDKEYQDKILQADLKAQGITNFGEIKYGSW